MSEAEYIPRNALIVFVDVIDSSRLSSYTGIVNYAKEIDKFQKLFKEVGNCYFPPVLNSPVKFTDVDTRGDEGTIFCIDEELEPGSLIDNAIEFIVELKSRLRIINLDADKKPHRMKLGAGIHYGEIAARLELTTIDGVVRKSITSVSGYEINYAKRVESSSRPGKHSKIYLSKKAASIIAGHPVILEKNNTEMKGIEQYEDVYEINSSFLRNIPRFKDPDREESYINEYTLEKKITGQPFREACLHEPWLKSFVVSLLSSLSSKPGVEELYSDRLQQFIWQNPLEDDAIMLFARADRCRIEKQFTQMLSYYRSIVDKYPNFIAARLKLAEACWEVAKNSRLPAEMIVARDTAEMFISRYSHALSEHERVFFQMVLDETNAPATPEPGE